jgi:hypothetical protein
MPDNHGETVHILQGADSAKRVAIVKRTDACYALRPERWYCNEWEGSIVAEGWIPIERQSGLFATPELAEREALATFDWLNPDRTSL